jgi:hypothetical protein
MPCTISCNAWRIFTQQWPLLRQLTCCLRHLRGVDNLAAKGNKGQFHQFKVLQTKGQTNDGD